jgi:hypothetical protein
MFCNVKLTPVNKMRVDKLTICRDFIITRRLAMELLLDCKVEYFGGRNTYTYPGYAKIGEKYDESDGILDRYFIKSARSWMTLSGD